MGSFVPLNISICGILNFAERGEVQHLDGEWRFGCFTKASMETRARPFTASFMWLIFC